MQAPSRACGPVPSILIYNSPISLLSPSPRRSFSALKVAFLRRSRLLPSGSTFPLQAPPPPRGPPPPQRSFPVTRQSTAEGRGFTPRRGGTLERGGTPCSEGYQQPRPSARLLPGNRHRRSDFGRAQPMSLHATAQSCVAGRLRVVRGGAGRGAAGTPEERWRRPELT